MRRTLRGSQGPFQTTRLTEIGLESHRRPEYAQRVTHGRESQRPDDGSTQHAGSALLAVFRTYISCVAFSILSGCVAVREQPNGASYRLTPADPGTVPHYEKPTFPEAASGHPLIVHASKPLRMSTDLRNVIISPAQYAGRFLITFHVMADAGGDLPIATIASPSSRSERPQVYGWEARDLGNGVVCHVGEPLAGIKTAVSSVSVDNSLRLLQKEGSPNFVNRTRPLMISADFECDGSVGAGDKLAIQARFYIREGFGWVPTDYILETSP